MKEPASQRARAYQLRNLSEGRCATCPKPRALRVIVDGETGDYIYVKRLVHCAEHWTYYRNRGHHNPNEGSV